MKVVTVEGFARNEPEGQEHRGYIYQGEAWLFRFRIYSPEYFFQRQLSHLVEVFRIDKRQIYDLLLRGNPGAGLSDVLLYVSFEEPPTQDLVDALQFSPPPLAEQDDFPDRCDLIDTRFTDFLKHCSRQEKQ